MTYIEDDEGLDDVSIGLQMQQFLDEWYYRILHSSLASQWDRASCITKVLELLEAQGMFFTREEVEYLSQPDLPEDELVQTLVKKMGREQRMTFEHFTLQLQLIVSTATRVRMALDEGTPEEVARIVEEGDTGITQQILKSACVEAAGEVSELREVHDGWKKSMLKRMDRLSKAAEATEQARGQLEDINDALGVFSSEQNSKSKKVLMSMTGNNDKLLVKSVFNTWQAYFYKYLSEKDIHDKFKAEIEAANVKLMQYKQQKVSNIRKVLIGSAEAGSRALLLEIVRTWHKETQDEKEQRDIQEKLAAASSKLDGMQHAQREKAKASMMRMGMGNDQALKTFSFSSWHKVIIDEKQLREYEEAQLAAEEALKECMRKKSEEARQVVARMVGASDSGLKSQVFGEWAAVFWVEKKERDAQKAIDEQVKKFKNLNDRQKSLGMGRSARSIDIEKDNLVMTVFMNWATEAQVERLHKYYSQKMESKKDQLQAVQHMFKSFATQLEGMSSTPRRSQRDKGKPPQSGPIA